MDTLEERIANLSPAKRALLEQYLTQQTPQLTGQQHIPRRTSSTLCPLSFSQQRLWFLHQLEPGLTAYNELKLFRVSGILNIAALRQSLGEIVSRHESQRTTFAMMNSIPHQVINPAPAAWSLPVVDLRALAPAEQAAKVEQRATAEAQRPFDLTQDLMLRTHLLQLADQEHLLLIVTHHIAGDGWSTSVFWRELSILYARFSQGQPSPLPALPLQYADYALWQRQSLQGERLATLLHYWQAQLAGAPERINLPLDFPRPAQQNGVGATCRFPLPKALTDAIKALSRQSEATLFMTLLTAFQVLLSRYTGQTDIVVGTPIAGRQHPALEDLIGMFVNTLVMRTNLAGNPSFKMLLQQVRSYALGAFAHQELPFERLVEALQPTRNLSYHPIFQVTFALQNTPKTTLELPNLHVQRLPVDNGMTKFDLSLSLAETATGLEGRLEYDTALFASSTMERMASHFVNLLEGVVANPDCPIAQLPILSAAEHRQLLVEWNNPVADEPQAKCLHQLLEEQVERTPDAIALSFEQETLTYRQLNARANQLARYLQTVGVGREMRVALCMERSLEMIVGILAILKAGGAYVPLDPSYPQARLAFMLADAEIALLVTQQALLPMLPATAAQRVCLDQDWPIIAQQSVETPPQTATSADLAYVIYTSGSTGAPKGVLVSHQNVVRLFTTTQAWFHFEQQDVWTLFHSYAFDFSVWELWGALLYGGKLVVIPASISRDPMQFYALLVRERVTVLNQTPAAFYQLMRADDAWPAKEALALRWIILGGEALDSARLRPWFARHSDQSPRVVNMYGITETTVHVTYRPLSQADLSHAASFIGRPLPDLQLYLLDAHQQLSPVGVPGEIYVGGAGVSRGYLNRPALCEERFIPNPFGAGRLYKSGDLARYHPNGELEYLGRMDHQIKIRGFRVELGEIEAILAKHPDVQQSLVIAAYDPSGNQRLIAYVVANANTTLAGHELRHYLAHKLPDYMLPAAFVLLAKLPLTANGKVDRQALPAPERTAESAEGQFVGARDPLERQLTQLWQKVLNIAPVGIHDSFFELGGHSLLAVQLFERMAKVTGKELPLSVLFQAPTIAHLAAILRQQNWQPAWQSLAPVQPGGHKPPLFLAPPGGSTTLRFANITRHLPDDQPVYGLEYLGMDGKSKPHDAIPAMAAYYLAEIRKLQPEAPYLLAGICFGAHLMLEVAQQLMAQGQLVTLLAVLDAGAPANGPTWEYPKRFSRAHFEMLYEHWQESGFLQWVRAHLTYRIGRVRKQMHPEKRRFMSVTTAHYQAQLNYVAKPYPGRLTLLQSEEYARKRELSSRWQSLAQGGYAYGMVTGTMHHTLLLQEPYTRLLAEQLARQLQQALTLSKS